MLSYKKVKYFSSMVIVLILSLYPLFMGMTIIKDYFALGMVDTANYPKYIIPYTPICLSIIISTAIIPLLSKIQKKFGFVLLSVFSIIIFFAVELVLENITLFSSAGTTNIGSWQMYLCVATPDVPVSSYSLLLGEYSPAFKIHFYLISVVIILASLNCIWGFYHLDFKAEKQKRKMLLVQLITVFIFMGLCIFACFTAFFRKGTLQISATSAMLMITFFVVFGITFGVFLCSMLYKKNKRFVRTASVAGAVIMTIAMYIGELVLLGGKLYRFGTGFLFDAIAFLPFAPADIFVIILSGLTTFIIVTFLLKDTKLNPCNYT